MKKMEHKFQVGEVARVHLWASFTCEIMGAFHFEDGKPYYNIYIPFRNSNWVQIPERWLEKLSK